MSARGRSENSRTSPSESPISRPLNQTVSFNKFKQPRSVLDWLLNFPLILYLLFRHLREQHQLFHEGKSAHGFPSRDLDLALKTVAVVTVKILRRLSHASPPIIPTARVQFCLAERHLPAHRTADQLQSTRHCLLSMQEDLIEEVVATTRGSLTLFKENLLLSQKKIDNLQGPSNTVLPQRRNENLPRDMQSRTQSPQAFWSAGRRQERLWDNGISYPRKRGIPVFVRMLKIKAEVKCPKMAAALLLLGLKVLSGLESVRESQNWFYTRSKGTGFFNVRADQSNWIFFHVRVSERWT